MKASQPLNLILILIQYPRKLRGVVKCVPVGVSTSSRQVLITARGARGAKRVAAEEDISNSPVGNVMIT